MRYEKLSLLRKSEERTKRKSRTDFDAELGFMEASFEVFLTTFEILSARVEISELLVPYSPANPLFSA